MKDKLYKVSLTKRQILCLHATAHGRIRMIKNEMKKGGSVVDNLLSKDGIKDYKSIIDTLNKAVDIKQLQKEFSLEFKLKS